MLIYISKHGFEFYVRTCRAPRGHNTQFIHIKDGWGVEAPREVGFYKVVILNKNAAWKWDRGRNFIANIRPLQGHLLLEWRVYGESVYVVNPLLLYDDHEFSIYVCSAWTRKKFYVFEELKVIDLEKVKEVRAIRIGPCESNKRTVKPDLTVGNRYFYGFLQYNERRLPVVGSRNRYENAMGIIEETRVMLYEDSEEDGYFERGVPLSYLPKLKCIKQTIFENDEDEKKYNLKYYVKVGEENIYIPPDMEGLEKLLIKED